MQCEGAKGGDPRPWSVLGVLALPCPRASQTAVLGPRGRREGAGAPDSGSSACAMHGQLWRASPRPAPTQVEGATDWPSRHERSHCAPVFPWARPSLRGSAPGTGPSPLSPARWHLPADGEKGVGLTLSPVRPPGASLRHEACLTPNGHRTLSCHLGPRAWPAPGTEWGSWWTGVEPQ